MKFRACVFIPVFLNYLYKRQPKSERYTKDGIDMQSGRGVRYIIQIDERSQRSDVDDVMRSLEEIGVQVDRSYGPILVNKKTGRYVIRGIATKTIRRQAEKISGVSFFADERIEPV
jgi:hypothetical protein